MSPETQELFDILIEDEKNNNIIEESDLSKHENAPEYSESDDSVRDPNFIIPNRVINIEDSETSCSSFGDNQDKNENSTSIKEPSNNNEIILGTHLDNTITNEELTTPIPLITADEEINEVKENVLSDLGTVRPKRGRKQVNSQLRSERKYNKYYNLEYTTTKNKKVKTKVFIDYKCTCLKNCASLITVEKRKEEFEKFVGLGSYNAQLLYIGSCIKEQNKKQSYTMTDVPAEKKKLKKKAETIPSHLFHNWRKHMPLLNLSSKEFGIRLEVLPSMLPHYAKRRPVTPDGSRLRGRT
ncbi:hypothetical protein K1T71_014837 [Dendrolimus kikuchii]|nr:hypothetical protein K1T71_014837 [Dendrolimus kikuchii]